MNYIQRQRKLKDLLSSKSLDALIIRKRQNISYLTGCQGEDAILFFSAGGNFLLTDARYKEEYLASINNCRLKIVGANEAYLELKRIAGKTRSKRIGFESSGVTYSEFAYLKRNLKNKKLVPLKDAVETLRMIKDDGEIRRIKEACKTGCAVMNHAVMSVRPSVSENAVKNRIKSYISKRGIRQAGFDVIVASGRNASKPHGSGSDKIIKRGEMVIIDLGTMDRGYNSDLTRTVFLGRIERKYSHVYDVVLGAQKKAIEQIRPGLKADYIDNISRQYILNRGFGKFFIHSLGHGIGLEVHEKPRISKNNDTILEKNMVITVEPGIYIPGWGGVRIEDVVLVTRNGCEVLTKRALCR